jgi:hypothetical protein
MKTLIQFTQLRCSRTFLAGLALTVAALLTQSMPASAKVRHTAFQSDIPLKHDRSVGTFQHHVRHRWLEVSLSKQRLIAWEGKTPVYSMPVSTGKRSTPTIQGSFAIQSKFRFARMQGRNYNVPNVPYTMYFAGGYAIHGAYWHNRFGTPVSHGCVNLPVGEAHALFKWASVGTQVVIHG